MSWSKIVAVTTVVLLVFGFAMIDSAFAGEKMKWHGTGITTVSEQIKLDEGHIVSIGKSKQIYIDETTGEKSHSVSIGIYDINIKKQQMSGHGYGISFNKDGTKTLRSWKGMPVGKGHWKGSWTIIGGTGKWEGATGGGTWESFSIAPDHSYMEVEGEMNPAQ
jgi:hypothetical protein